MSLRLALLALVAALCSWHAAAASMVNVPTGNTVFFSHHADSKCQGPSFAVTSPRQADGSKVSINKCISSATAGNIKLQCKLGAIKFTLSQFKYGASDTTCSAAPVSSSPTSVSSIVKHDYMCQESRSGGYVKIHCGEDSSALLQVPSVVSPKLFSDASCSFGSPVWRSNQIGTCSPYYQGQPAKVAFFYKLTVQTPATSTSGLALRMTKYGAGDNACTGRVMAVKAINYAAPSTSTTTPPTCTADPLHPGYYYNNVVGSAPYKP